MFFETDVRSVQWRLSCTILISDIPSTSTTPATYYNSIENTNIDMDSQNEQIENENSFQLRWIIAIVLAFLTVVLLLSITELLLRGNECV